MSSERRRIASAATLILVAYGLSRVLGAVRELVIANTFGTSHQIDDYRVAFGVPDLLFNLLLAGAISSAFIPVLSEHLAKGEHQRALHIAQRVLNSAIVVLTAVSGAGEGKVSPARMLSRTGRAVRTEPRVCINQLISNANLSALLIAVVDFAYDKDV